MVKHLQLAVVMELFCYGKFHNGGLNLLMAHLEESQVRVEKALDASFQVKKR